jgi:hypothetical protein
MLVPRFWSPWIELGDSEDRLGLATGGSDALFRHVWAARLTYGTGTERLNFNGFYLYDRFRPTLVVSGQNTTAVSERGDVRTLQLNLQASMPLRADGPLDPEPLARLQARARGGAGQQRARGPRRARRAADELDLVERACLSDVDLALRGLAACA